MYDGAKVRSLRLTDDEWADLDALVELLPRPLLSDVRRDNGRNRDKPSRSEAVSHAVRSLLESTRLDT